MNQPEPEKPSGETGPGESSRTAARSLEARALELQANLQNIAVELQLLAENLEARKRENTILKIMLYTGVVVLMLAFFYTSNALQQAQLQSFETGLDHLQTLTQSNLTALQRRVLADVGRLKASVRKLELAQNDPFVQERRLEAALVNMNRAIAPLGAVSGEWKHQVERLNLESEELFEAFQDFAVDAALPRESSRGALP